MDDEVERILKSIRDFPKERVLTPEQAASLEKAEQRAPSKIKGRPLPSRKERQKQQDHEKLRDLALVLANEVCVKINSEAPKLETPTMPYRQQYVLEELIKILEERV